MDGTTWSAPVAEGEGTVTVDGDNLRAGPREVRSHHADGECRGAPTWSIQRLRLYEIAETK